MKATFLICCILVMALLGSSCSPEAALEVVAGDDAISMIATLMGNMVMIENVGDVDCVVTVTSPEGEQQFEVAVGENLTVTNVSQPIEISAVSSATT
jgi:hypothetical protein